MQRIRILVLPGLDNSGPLHWQSIWEAKQPFANSVVERMEHSNWTEPQFDTWMAELDAVLGKDMLRPTVLVAHSLGCLNAIHRLKYSGCVKAALLVAPANPQRPGFPERVKGFTLPSEKLHFLSTLVASENDPYASLEFSQSLARTLGSKFINIGPFGHVNGESGLGDWKFGQDLVHELLATLPKTSFL